MQNKKKPRPWLPPTSGVRADGRGCAAATDGTRRVRGRLAGSVWPELAWPLDLGVAMAAFSVVRSSRGEFTRPAVREPVGGAAQGQSSRGQRRRRWRMGEEEAK